MLVTLEQLEQEIKRLRVEHQLEQLEIEHWELNEHYNCQQTLIQDLVAAQLRSLRGEYKGLWAVIKWHELEEYIASNEPTIKSCEAQGATVSTFIAGLKTQIFQRGIEEGKLKERFKAIYQREVESRSLDTDKSNSERKRRSLQHRLSFLDKYKQQLGKLSKQYDDHFSLILSCTEQQRSEAESALSKEEEKTREWEEKERDLETRKENEKSLADLLKK